jgi:hypothetical protein
MSTTIETALTPPRPPRAPRTGEPKGYVAGESYEDSRSASSSLRDTCHVVIATVQIISWIAAGLQTMMVLSEDAVDAMLKNTHWLIVQDMMGHPMRGSSYES